MNRMVSQIKNFVKAGQPHVKRVSEDNATIEVAASPR